jgi:hypothetical protein
MKERMEELKELAKLSATAGKIIKHMYACGVKRGREEMVKKLQKEKFTIKEDADFSFWLKEEYPTTIVADRYGGSYSGAAWLAFPFDECPLGVDGGDLECMEFWDNYKGPVGKGNTPDNALENLRLNILNRYKKHECIIED